MRFELREERTDDIEVTRNGMLGGPADPDRRFIAGFRSTRCFVDGREVSREEWLRLYEAENGPLPPLKPPTRVIVLRCQSQGCDAPVAVRVESEAQPELNGEYCTTHAEELLTRTRP